MYVMCDVSACVSGLTRLASRGRVEKKGDA